MKNHQKASSADSNAIATNQFKSSDYTSQEAIAQGLAITHEQATDAYKEGTVDQEIKE
ncbi:DUF4025 domain-containing protein [bacterium LRH843]|nr:DUF4025 domain-containing protein [bacterium LRH843]